VNDGPPTRKRWSGRLTILHRVRKGVDQRDTRTEARRRHVVADPETGPQGRSGFLMHLNKSRVEQSSTFRLGVREPKQATVGLAWRWSGECVIC
jgi:hypothetical protein